MDVERVRARELCAVSTLSAEVLMLVAEAATPLPWNILPIHSLGRGGEMVKWWSVNRWKGGEDELHAYIQLSRFKVWQEVCTCTYVKRKNVTCLY